MFNLNFVISFKIYSEELLPKVIFFGFDMKYFWRFEALLTDHSNTFRSCFGPKKLKAASRKLCQIGPVFNFFFFPLNYQSKNGDGIYLYKD